VSSALWTAVPSVPVAPMRRIFMAATLCPGHRVREIPSGKRLCSVVMNVELRHLRALAAIGDEGTITGAAVALHISQPALSRTLEQLESRVGEIGRAHV